ACSTKEPTPSKISKSAPPIRAHKFRGEVRQEFERREEAEASQMREAEIRRAVGASRWKRLFRRSRVWVCKFRNRLQKFPCHHAGRSRARRSVWCHINQITMEQAKDRPQTG